MEGAVVNSSSRMNRFAPGRLRSVGSAHRRRTAETVPRLGASSEARLCSRWMPLPTTRWLLPLPLLPRTGLQAGRARFCPVGGCAPLAVGLVGFRRYGRHAGNGFRRPRSRAGKKEGAPSAVLSLCQRAPGCVAGGAYGAPNSCGVRIWQIRGLLQSRHRAARLQGIHWSFGACARRTVLRRRP